MLTIGTLITTLVTLLIRHEAGVIRLPTRGQPLTNSQAHHLAVQLATIVAPVVVGTALLAVFLETVLTCLLTAVVAEGALGRKPTMGEAWRIGRSRLWPVLGALILIALGVTAMWAVLFVIVAVLAASHAGGLAVLVAVIGGIAVLCLTVWTLVSTYLIAPVVVLERQRPIQAIRRSWRLVRRSFWRMFGILLLATLVVALTSLVLQIPFSLLARVGGGAGELGGLVNGGSAAAVIISAIGSIVVGSVARPIGAGVVVLIYLDLRMRKEGFDLALQTAAASGAPSGDEFATLWRPPPPGSQPAAASAAAWPGTSPAYPSQPYPGSPPAYPGQPYAGQPYPSQPYPGQPYPSQPYPGQPYPSQPYPGQHPPGQRDGDPDPEPGPSPPGTGAAGTPPA